ncbi:MAG: FkbM family methyltransferase [Opitutaceae bacterium]
MSLPRRFGHYCQLLARYIENPRALSVKFRGGIPGTYSKLDQAWFHRLGLRSVIDVGTNYGQFARTMRTLLPAAQIYGFEPIPACFEHSKRAFAGDEKFAIFNLALAERKGVATFTVASGDTGASSLLAAGAAQKQYFPHTLQSRTIEVPIDTLDRVMASQLVASPYLLKIDVQGYEHQVLCGGIQTLQQASLVLLEASYVSFYEGQKLFDEVYELLRHHGFRLSDMFNMMYSPETGAALQGDFLFVKSS